MFFGLDGQVRNLRTRTGEGCYLYSGRSRWSPDSQRLPLKKGFTQQKEVLLVKKKRTWSSWNVNSDQTASFKDSSENLQWFSDNISVLHGLAVINSETGRTSYFRPPLTRPAETCLLTEKYITYYAAVDPTSVCYGRGESDMWAMISVKPSADLRMAKEKSAMILRVRRRISIVKATRSSMPTKRIRRSGSCAPPSETPVMDDMFTTWVPPYEGPFM